jgi:hypothetical protein
MFIRVCLILVLGVGRMWSQVGTGATPAAEDPMVTPSLVNVEGQSLAFAAEQEHRNYLRGGVSVYSAYDDGLLSVTGAALGDVSYSLRPSIAIDESGGRLHWNLFYSPGFTFYQRNTPFNQSDHSLAGEFQYRLSPHVTLTLRDGLSKSSSLFYGSDPNPTVAETGILLSPNQSIVSPIANTLTNNANGQITYQFSENGMIGATGTETEQHYLNLSQVRGLFNSSNRGATGFYAYRLSRKHYIGATYQFEQLLSYPNGTETQTHAPLLFYTLYMTPALSLALFAGPEHFETNGLGIPTNLGWLPTGGAALQWQGLRTSATLGFSHRVTDGGGLESAVISSTAELSIRRQLTKNVTVGLSGDYALNTLIDPTLLGNGGHTLSASLSLQRSVGEHFSLELGYANLHQTYSDVPAISTIHGRNRGWVSFSYNFQRPLGR